MSLQIGDWVIAIGGGMMVEGYGFQIERFSEIDGREVLHGDGPIRYGHTNDSCGGYPVQLRTPYCEFRDRVWPAQFNDRGFLVAKTG